MAKQISNMGQRAYANLMALVGSMKKLREEAGHVKDDEGRWRDENGKLVESLSRFHIAIGATIDDNERLLDSQGRLIDGMSNADVALGRYIDSQGRMRDSQDRIIEGLKSSEKAAGMWKDELGNVYDANEKLIRSVEKVNAGAKLNAEQAVQAARGLGQLVAMITIYTGKANPAAKAAVSLSAGLSAGTVAMQAAERASKLLAAVKGLLSVRTWAEFKAQMALNGATGNFVGIAAGIAAGASAAVMAYNAMSESADSAANSVGRLYESGKKFANGDMVGFMEGIADRFKTDFEKLERRLQEEISTLREIADTSVFEKVREEASRLADKVQEQLEKARLDQASRLLEEDPKTKKQREEAEKRLADTKKWLADQERSAWTESQRIKEDLDRAIKEQEAGTEGAVGAVNALKEKYDKAVRSESLSGLDNVIAKATEASMNFAEKEKQLADEMEAQTKRLRELNEKGIISQRELDDTTRLLTEEMKKKVDSLHETQWDKSFKDMFEMRVPIDQRLSEAFSGIEEAGKRLGASAEEVEKLKEFERDRLKKMYGMEEKQKQEEEQKNTSGSANGTFAVAGSVEAWRISTASSQDRTTKAVDRVRSAVKDAGDELARTIREVLNIQEV